MKKAGTLRKRPTRERREWRTTEAKIYILQRRMIVRMTTADAVGLLRLFDRATGLAFCHIYHGVDQARGTEVPVALMKYSRQRPQRRLCEVSMKLGCVSDSDLSFPTGPIASQYLGRNRPRLEILTRLSL